MAFYNIPTVFIIMSLFFILQADAMFFNQGPCSKGEQYETCPNVCISTCSYGNYPSNNATCKETYECKAGCVCKFGYILDSRSRQCWSVPYCWFRQAQTTVTNILWNIFGKWL